MTSDDKEFEVTIEKHVDGAQSFYLSTSHKLYFDTELHTISTSEQKVRLVVPKRRHGEKISTFNRTFNVVCFASDGSELSRACITVLKVTEKTKNYISFVQDTFTAHGDSAKIIL